MAKGDQVFIARDSGVAENPKTGESLVFQKDVTRVAGNHWLVKQVPDAFMAAEDNLTYQVESATAKPGEKREAPAPDPEPVAAETPAPEAAPEPEAEAPAPKRRGRPPKAK